MSHGFSATETIDACKAALVDASVKRFGSGWGWLVAKDSTVKVESTPNAETPIVCDGMVPLLVVDVWEHAYYLKSLRGLSPCGCEVRAFGDCPPVAVRNDGDSPLVKHLNHVEK